MLLQSYALSDKILKRHEISSLSNTAKFNEVEGSGIPPLLSDRQKTGGASVDVEWDGSGISPDDEDGDVVEGSGAQIDEDDSDENLRVTTSATSIYSLNTTLTTAQYSSFDIHELEVESDEEDVAIEEIPATTVTVQSRMTTTKRPSLQPLTPLITKQTAPPTVFDDKHNIPFDALLKPGVLAALIGGIVVGILATILLVMFVVYRMRKKDEGSYALDEPKQPPQYSYAYQKAPTKEFYA
ncbi:Syndecan domain family protein [Brugia pahangi]